MAKAPEKKNESPPKQKANPKELVAYVANLITIHQFIQAVHSTANPAIAKELTRATDELIEALDDKA